MDDRMPRGLQQTEVVDVKMLLYLALSFCQYYLLSHNVILPLELELIDIFTHLFLDVLSQGDSDFQDCVTLFKCMV